MIETAAVLSDIHGVLPALDAVLAEPDVQHADLIVVTGDHAAGPQPRDVLDRLQGLGERALLVRGNADRDLVALARGESLPSGEPVPIDAWAAQQLSPAQVALLASLPHPLRLEIEGLGTAVFCHGTPRDEDEVVLVDTRLERWQEAFADLDDDVATVVCGHTHMPFVRLVDRRRVVNAGSVGMPYGSTGVSWALLSGAGVSLRTTPLAAEALAYALGARSSFPEIEAWVEEYVLSPASDVDALHAFAPRDGR